MRPALLQYALTGITLCFIYLHSNNGRKKFKDEDKPGWAKKDIRDFTDADMERLLDQWEVKELLFGKYL